VTALLPPDVSLPIIRGALGCLRSVPGEPEPVHRAAESLGARLVLAPLAVADGSPRHDPESLGVALVPVLGAAR